MSHEVYLSKEVKKSAYNAWKRQIYHIVGSSGGGGSGIIKWYGWDVVNEVNSRIR